MGLVDDMNTDDIRFPGIYRPPDRLIVRAAKKLRDRAPLVFDAADRGLAAARRARSPAQIEAYLRSHETRMLKLGAGWHATPGWLSVDIAHGLPDVAYMDATKPFPLPSDSFDFAQCEHVIEHLPYRGGLAMLRESHRVLREGGVLRIATPDLDLVRRLLADGESDPLLRAYVEWSDRMDQEWSAESEEPVGTGNPVFTVNRYVRFFGHTFLYDERTLRDSLESAGFRDIVVLSPGESSRPELRGIDRHHEEIGEQPNLLETLVMEAVC